MSSGSRRAARGRRRKARKRSGIRVAGLLTVVAGLAAGGVVAVSTLTSADDVEEPDPPLAAGPAETTQPADASPIPETSPPPSPSASAEPSPTEEEDDVPGPVPETGPGTFTMAQADGSVQGTGELLQYRVLVEDGLDISAEGAAHEIAAILGHERGWISNGGSAFQLVSSDEYDFQIKISTPETTDAICATNGLETHGELNCKVGWTTPTVAVNLRRWVIGSPQFNGPVEDYRALIINHEVGHVLGYTHRGCAGPGLPAPAMMQQIKGLNGCYSNAWPYDENGRLITGPPV